MRRITLARPDGVRYIPDAPSGGGVLIMAGSSGRVDWHRARAFAALGCVAESIRWFGGAGQDPTPSNIPLETILRPLYERSRARFPERVDAATIPVERIPQLMLVAGGDDQVWPSVAHAERIQTIRARAGLSTLLVTSKDAGLSSSRRVGSTP